MLKRRVGGASKQKCVMVIAKRECEHHTNPRESIREEEVTSFYRYAGMKMPIHVCRHGFPEAKATAWTFIVAEIFGFQLELVKLSNLEENIDNAIIVHLLQRNQQLLSASHTIVSTQLAL